MKYTITQLFIMLTLLCAANAKAETTPNTLLYIQPFEYSNEVKLQHFSQEYWFAQGPILEPIAKKKIEKQFGNVAICEGNQMGKMLIWLQPKMFYNGQLQVFYGKVTANVYSGVGNLIGKYNGEFTQRGNLGIKPEHWIKKAYENSIDLALAKMQADSQLQNLAKNTTTGDTPCSMVTLLPQPKIRALGF